MRLLFALLLSLLAIGADRPPAIDHALIAGDAAPPSLSSFGFFDGRADRPNPAMIGYTLRTPLFSDYAVKQRWIVLPPGGRMQASGAGLVQFPVGTAIIKSFGYPGEDGLRIIETRLLLHRASGWVALPYVWRADGTDADLRLGGARVPVSFTDPSGTRREISYAVPNRNQCKSCHQQNEAMTPIGPQLRNLDLDAHGRAQMDGADWSGPRLPVWDNPATGTEADRARAYLDVNCAHCHRPGGLASNSGLYLEYERATGYDTGVLRRPVAAGRGSGGHAFDIAPGDAASSILPYRMDSIDPGIAMPELGRATVHNEGVALVREWINAMPPASPVAP